jgi:hypothetical protein
MLLSDRFAKAIYPCAKYCDNFVCFRRSKGRAPFCGICDLVYPYREGRRVILGLEEPFVREAGGGACGRFWGGSCEVWDGSILLCYNTRL